MSLSTCIPRVLQDILRTLSIYPILEAIRVEEPSSDGVPVEDSPFERIDSLSQISTVQITMLQHTTYP